MRVQLLQVAPLTKFKVIGRASGGRSFAVAVLDKGRIILLTQGEDQTAMARISVADHSDCLHAMGPNGQPSTRVFDGAVLMGSAHRVRATARTRYTSRGSPYCPNGVALVRPARAVKAASESPSARDRATAQHTSLHT